MNVLSEKLGKPPRFVTSESGFVSRHTDRETLEIFMMVTAGKINKLLVEELQRLGVNAFGLSGLDGQLLQGVRKGTLRIVENGKTKVLRGDYGGRIRKANPGVLNMLIEAGYLPVVAPLAISEQGEALNVDADRVAAAIAAAVQAETLVILSNVPGLLRSVTDENSLIPRIPKLEIEEYLNRYAQGKMKKKLLGATEALTDGVERVVIADGRIEQPVQRALAGQGTVIE
jgi:acetylglutamate/LysW-gamma-L-alpha-aminoadipate kinase